MGLLMQAALHSGMQQPQQQAGPVIHYNRRQSTRSIPPESIQTEVEAAEPEASELPSPRGSDGDGSDALEDLEKTMTESNKACLLYTSPSPRDS